MSSVAEPDLSQGVLVVGAGPTGLIAASLLARFNIPVRIIDKSEGAAKESRAMVVQARSLELFQLMGLAEAILDRGIPATGAQLVVDGRPAATIEFDDIGRSDTPFPFPFMIAQSETEQVLLQDLEAQGLKVEYGSTITGLEQRPDGVRLEIETPSGKCEVTTAYLIGADGAHSFVRKALSLSLAGAAYTQNFLLADCRVTGLTTPSGLAIFLHGTELAPYLPMCGADQARIIVVAPGDGSARDAGLETQGSSEIALSEVEKAFRRIAHADVTLSDPVWTSRYRVHHRGVDQYRVGRVFVAGDAAHIHSPAGGQGMNTGLQDAANLAWKLASVLRGGAPALLDSYHDERWPVGQKILDRTDKMFAGMTTTSPLFAALRNLALPVVVGPALQSQAVRARAFHFISELGIHYHEGAFVQEGTPNRHSTPRAGWRAPDARVSRTTSVFDLFKPDRFVVLAISAVPLTEQEITDQRHALDSLPDTVGGLPLEAHLIARSRVGRCHGLLQAELPEISRHSGTQRIRRRLCGSSVPTAILASDHLGWRQPSFAAFSTGFRPDDTETGNSQTKCNF